MVHAPWQEEKRVENVDHGPGSTHVAAEWIDRAGMTDSFNGPGGFLSPERRPNESRRGPPPLRRPLTRGSWSQVGGPSRWPSRERNPPHTFRLTLLEDSNQVNELDSGDNRCSGKDLRTTSLVPQQGLASVQGGCHSPPGGGPRKGRRMFSRRPCFRDPHPRTFGHDRYQRKTIPVAVRTSRGKSTT